MAEKSISRRAALRKLGLGVVAAYCAPKLITVSSAAASTNPTAATPPTAPSPAEPDVSKPSAPDASLPSGPEQADWRDDDSCSVHASRNQQATISNSDFRRAQRAVKNGEARHLSEVFQSVQTEVQGQLIEVRFNNAGVPPIYQFRMVTQRGRLITVFTDAKTAEILRIVNC